MSSSPPSPPRAPRRAPILFTRTVFLLGVVAALVVACTGGEEEPPPVGAELAERWLRAGEDANANVAVFERALPPYLVDLFNPERDADTPDEDLVALPVHPDGELLGSYVLRRADGSHVVWLFYDVPAAIEEVTGAVAEQLDESPWQVTQRQGSRANRIVTFESTRTGDVTGNALVESSAPDEALAVVVERDGETVTLEVRRAAPQPLLEVNVDDDLVVEQVFPGFAQAAGLQEGDVIRRVGETDVSTPDELRSALEALTPEVTALLYLLQFAPPSGVEAPPFVPSSALSLPEAFPAPEAWDGLGVEGYQVGRDTQGEFFVGSFLTEDSPTTVANRVRDALEAAGWEIVSDEAQGFGTAMQFQHAGEELAGFVQIGEAQADQSLTEVFVQIQAAPSGGN